MGSFLRDLKAAIVKKIHLLKEEDFFYELEAEATAGSLDQLSVVFVIPPLGMMMQIDLLMIFSSQFVYQYLKLSFLYVGL